MQTVEEFGHVFLMEDVSHYWIKHLDRYITIEGASGMLTMKGAPLCINY